MRRHVLGILFFFCCGSVAAASDFSLFAGWTGTGSLRTQLGRVEVDNFSLAGVRYERYYAIFGLENSLAYQFGSIGLAGADQKDDALSYTGNLVINIPLARLVPFFGVGLGLFHRFGDSPPDVGTRFQTNYGFGVKLRRLAGPLGLRADFRRFNIRGVMGENLRTNELSSGVMVSF